MSNENRRLEAKDMPIFGKVEKIIGLTRGYNKQYMI
jgi:hypothetical protein